MKKKRLEQPNGLPQLPSPPAQKRGEANPIGRDGGGPKGSELYTTIDTHLKCTTSIKGDLKNNKEPKCLHGKNKPTSKYVLQVFCIKLVVCMLQ